MTKTELLESIKKDEYHTFFVVSNENNIYMVVDNKFIRNEGWLKIDGFEEDLTFYDSGMDEFSIKEIRKVGVFWSLSTLIRDSFDSHSEIVWTRPERIIPKKEMTVAEIEQTLGYSIKVVKE